ncbi:MAG TPA: glycosyl hydrolase 115 family protein [Opitutaceae bacterium]|nr:glycosyl hydrolase 115 family protein [Opitutaceae bacterium]
MRSLRIIRLCSVALAVSLAVASVHGALGDPSLLGAGAARDFALVRAGSAAPLLVSPNDWSGVRRAAGDLQADIERVSGQKPALGTGIASATVIIGTVGRSEVIDGLVAAGKLDVAAIRGRWESFLIETVENPLPGIERALVIAGSDKRGTIYGIYDLSEEIGVSPWYWWADVPVVKRDALFVSPGRRVNTGPVVKYRGIFLNDEAPALTGWTKEKFGGFNQKFYGRLFELLLRLRANYLWPAMWRPQAFNVDDPQNPALADEYGIVMGTSHHEPLMRAHEEWSRYGKGPWDYSKNEAVLREFWRASVERTKNYENIQSLGMRGDGDEAMSAETNTALLERIVADQRTILTEVAGKKIEEVPQLWALYKEVQGYYEKGMRVPEDVTLLWCDDNWGNIRRLPTPAERARPGGAGVYYHFDYVGGPRNYKWLNTIPLTKISEQMNLAWQHDANRIWIVNVGDLKPMEFPIEFFLRLAWNPARWPYEKLGDYSRTWAAREFGPKHAEEIAALINGYTKLNSRRKPEMLAPDTFSLVNYREAESVMSEWKALVTRAGSVDTALPAGSRAAFFQLVLHPIKACAIVNELHVVAGLNRLYATQGRASTNALGEMARELFRADAALTQQWDALLDGKWRHLMDQAHLGYTLWQQPVRNAMPAVTEVQPYPAAGLALAVEGDPMARPGDYPVPAEAILPALSVFDARPRRFEIFNRGETPTGFTLEADQPWLRVTPSSGSVGPDVRINVTADWSQVPSGEHRAKITVRGTDTGQTLVVKVPVSNPVTVGAAGFVETDRVVAIEAPHFARAIAADGVEWRTLPDFGPKLGGVTAFPVTLPPIAPGGGSPRLEYDVHLFSSGEVTLELHCAPSLDFQSGDGLRLGVSFDDAPPQIVKLDTWATNQTWDRAVADGVRRVTTKHRVEKPGNHVLKFWLVTPGVVLERIVIDCGGVKPSYMGPPESFRIGN